MPLVLKNVSYSYTGNAKASQRNRRTTPSVAQHGEPTWGILREGQALDNVSLTLTDGEFLGLAGHTGSGKSTLLQVMAGLIAPHEGSVRFNDADLTNKKQARALRGRIGLVFQYPEHQLFAATVAEDIAFGPRNLGVPEQEIQQRVKRSLELMDLPESILEASPFALSGGQQRRVAFAGVLAMNPQALLLDEPMARLDPASRERFAQLIAGLHREGLTLCMVSHDMDDLATLCDRVVVMNLGRVHMEGTPLEVFSQEDALKDVGLNAPEGMSLANLLRSRGMDLPVRAYTAKELAEAIVAAQSRNTPEC